MVGGIPQINAPSQLIEIPKVAPVPVTELGAAEMFAKRGMGGLELGQEMRVFLFAKSGGKPICFTAKSFVVQVEAQEAEYGQSGDWFVSPRQHRMTWRMDGIVTEEPMVIV